jgi:hybrid cluster-associated redox disulfide protein
MTKKANPKITGKTTISEMVSSHPKVSEILIKYGLHCIGCHIAMEETIEEGAKAHGLSGKEISKMIVEINQSIK